MATLLEAGLKVDRAKCPVTTGDATQGGKAIAKAGPPRFKEIWVTATMYNWHLGVCLCAIDSWVGTTAAVARLALWH